MSAAVSRPMRRSVFLGLLLSSPAVAAFPALAGAQPSTPPVPPDVAGPPPTAIRTPTGLAYRVLRPGRGSIRARPTSELEIHYTGWQTNGTMFDSSRTRGAPATFRLENTIAGFQEGVSGMTEGEARRIWIPEALAYGPTGRMPGMLVFDVELLRIVTW